MIPAKTFAMVQTAPRTLEMRDLPIPDIEADSAILRIEACGICGSDYEQFEGVLKTPMPVIPGHEPVGIIEAIGDKAARRWGVDVGDRVAVETMLSCHSCDTCLGRPLSPVRRPADLFLHPAYRTAGALGRLRPVHVPRAQHDRSQDGQDLAARARGDVQPAGGGFPLGGGDPSDPGRRHDRHPGTGPARSGQRHRRAAGGAGKIIVTGMAADARKLDLARTFGAHHTIDVQNENAIERIKELTGGRGADVVVEVTSYATDPVREALSYVRAGGTIVLAGVKGFKPIPDFVSDLIVFKEITIKGAIGVTSSGYRKAIDLIEARSLPLELMHTHDFALEDAELAIRTLARQVAGDESIHSCLIPPT